MNSLTEYPLFLYRRDIKMDELLYSYGKKVRSVWATPENPRGKKGFGGQQSFARKGNACFYIGSGQTLTLAKEQGSSGVIRRIWMTLSDLRPVMLRSLRLDMYWDGEDQPAVSVPLGDFFGAALGRMMTYESELFSIPEARSLNTYIPMPFKNGMKITLTNECEDHLYMFFYEINYTLGDVLSDDMLYFHSWFGLEDPTRIRNDYTILPKIKGKGRFLGTHISVAADHKYSSSWWGEGECKIYLDGDDEYPSLCGTGTEDYIGTGWELGRYHNKYQGCQLCDLEQKQFGFYRFHIPDPVYFNEDIKVTMQQIGSWRPKNKSEFLKNNIPIYHAGELATKELIPVDFTNEDDTPAYSLFEREDTWAGCAYFYLDKPVNELPGLPVVEKRVKALPEGIRKEGIYMVPQEVQIMKKYLKDGLKLAPEDLRIIKDCCEMMLLYHDSQQEWLKKSDEAADESK